MGKNHKISDRLVGAIAPFQVVSDLALGHPLGDEVCEKKQGSDLCDDGDAGYDLKC